jgi:MFS family permease
MLKIKTLIKERKLLILIVNNALFSFSRTLPGATLVLIVFSYGISLKTIALAKGLQLLVSSILTIPAGILADRFGRKNCLILSCLSEAFYFFLMIDVTDNKLILGEIFNGVGLSLYNGAYEGLLLSFNKKNSKYEFSNNVLKSWEYVFLAMMISSLIGALLGKYVFFVATISLLLVTLFFLLIPEPVLHVNRKHASFHIVKKTIQYFMSNRNGMIILLAGALYLGLIQFLFQFWQPFFKNFGINNNITFGVIFSLTLLGQYLVTTIMRKLPNKISFVKKLVFCWLGSFFISFALVFSDVNNQQIIIFLYCAFNALMAGANNLVSILASKSIDENFHSTGISVIDFFGRVVGALSLLMISPFISLEYIKYTWFFVGIAFMFIAINFIKHRKNYIDF